MCEFVLCQILLIYVLLSLCFSGFALFSRTCISMDKIYGVHNVSIWAIPLAKNYTQYVTIRHVDLCAEKE